MKVLDKGFVELIDVMGNEQRIIDAARITVDAKKKAKRSDLKLLDYLYTNGHLSPFEHVHFTFKVKAPIFVLRQWMRHRTWNYCELSMRYTKSEGDFWSPPDDGFWYDVHEEAMDDYNWLISQGLPREQARARLPISMYSTVMMTVDLRNLLHFLKLRTSEHAQREIQDYAYTIEDLISDVVPNVINIYRREKWVEGESKSPQDKLRHLWMMGYGSTKSVTSSAFQGLLSSLESKSSESDEVEENTSESSNDAQDVSLQSLKKSLPNIPEKFSQETLESWGKFLDFAAMWFAHTFDVVEQAQKDLSGKS